jgi:hypothetical protein
MNCKLFYLIFLNSYIIPIFSSIAPSLSQNSRYPQFCQLAARDDELFATFRRQPTYREIVETADLDYAAGMAFIQEITQQYPHLLPYFKRICAEDVIGNPVSYYYPNIGTICPGVLRYIKIVGDLQREFGDLSNFNIVEIGGGYGGQCKMLKDITGFDSYTIIDLPECTPLVNRYLSLFNINNFKTIACNTLHEPMNCDLVISNYAFSEIHRNGQIQYMEMIINAAPRGYFIYNHCPRINPFSINEFVALLEKQNKKVKIIQEPNLGEIIIWNS